ncbi:MAG: type II toxin-antitoxin system PemK/MazF family toxin [Spirochaetales bacterium]|nr:type II toxin-antitoxin system PemK/MazF family toxin [Spirochaetales bacterium]
MDRWRWSIAYVYLDPIVGREQGGNRPVLIVSDETFNEAMSVVTVLPITSRKAGRTVYRNEVLLSPTDSGLPVESIVLAHQIRTISKDRIKRRVGFLDDAHIREACLEAVRIHVGIY